jgi:hypothetical protein
MLRSKVANFNFILNRLTGRFVGLKACLYLSLTSKFVGKIGIKFLINVDLQPRHHMNILQNRMAIIKE